ncbi:putative protein S-acyltransferase 14 [Senna tora]|uniref:Uncharacterized protein n=1 Tax=Senna tora TaxID=362788 RepID=A0A834XI80_9FABA|nr:putative protein S-acyltransferase 14 [Senna tora]
MFLNNTVGASLLLPLYISPQFRTKRILKSSIVLLSKRTLYQSDIEDSPSLIATQKRRREAESHSAALRKEGNGAKNKRSLFTLRYGAQKTNEAMEAGIARHVTLEEELYTFLETSLVTVSLLPEFISFFSDGEIIGTPGSLATTFLAFVLDLAFALSVLGFLIMHILLVAGNTTTIEAYEKKTTPKWRYDLGRRKNFEQHHMKGRPTLWLPGTDHAGIATQSWQWLTAPHPQTPPFVPPQPQSPLLPPVNYMVVVVASAAVVDSPPKTRPSAPPVPKPLLPPPVNYMGKLVM